MQIVHNEDTALSAIIADLRTKEMAVESTKRVWLFPLRQHGRRVVIWIGKHNAGSRARENELRHILCSEVAEILSYFVVRPFRYRPNALIGEYALQFLKKESGQKENVLWRVDN
jgi:hypothetical protein